MHIAPDENGTCTLMVLKNFDEARHWHTLDEFKESLMTCIESFNDHHGDWNGDIFGEGWTHEEWEEYPFHTLQMVTATTSHRQDNAEKMLEEFGFKKYGPKKALKYGSDSLLTLWFLDTKSILKKLRKK